MKNFKLIFTCLILILTGSGCNVKSDFDKMRDATLEMNTTTKEMSGTMKDMNSGMTEQMKSMSGKMEKIDAMADKMGTMLDRMEDITSRTVVVTGKMAELQKTTDSVVLDARQAGSLQTRHQMLEKMHKAESLKAKFVLAAVYYSSFEFQLWRLSGPNPEEELARMYSDAMVHILNDLNQYILDDYTKGTDAWPIVFSGKATNEGKSLMALAAALHWKNPQHKVIERENGRTTMTAYELIEKGLLTLKDPKLKDIDFSSHSSEIPEYIKNVRMFKSNAIFLMHLRYNALANIVLGQTGGIKEILYGDENSLGSVFKKSILSYLGITDKWEVDISKLDKAEMALNIELLQHWAKTKRLLEALGEKPNLNSNFKMVLKRAEIKNTFAKNESHLQKNANCVSSESVMAQNMCGTTEELARKLQRGLVLLKKSAED